MRFLGTGAAECLPCPFCDCPLCVEARNNPEFHRLRAAFQLDQHTLLDFGPDLAASAQKLNISLATIEHVILTHSHEDHFYLNNLSLMEMSSTFRYPLHFYLSESAYNTHGQAFISWQEKLPFPLHIHPLKVGEPISVGAYTVTPIPTTHPVSETEVAYNYIIEYDGHHLLYGTDTGLYPSEALKILQTVTLDVFISEATFGSTPLAKSHSHLNGALFIQQLETLLAQDTVTPHTKVYATHINHKHEWNHHAYQAFFDDHAPVKVTVAHDGLSIE